VRTFLGTLVSHAVLDGGALVAAHAGLPEHLQGRSSAVERAVAVTGHDPGAGVDGRGARGDDHPDGSGSAADRPREGTPVGPAGRQPGADRTLSWVADYRGPALVVYGHTPIDTPRFERNTIGIDTGCVFGGALTALRYPERTLVSVPARRVHYRGVPERRR
jgi:protein phosphatase